MLTRPQPSFTSGSPAGGAELRRRELIIGDSGRGILAGDAFTTRQGQKRGPVQTKELAVVLGGPHGAAPAGGRADARTADHRPHAWPVGTLSRIERFALPVRPRSWAALAVRELGLSMPELVAASDHEARVRALGWCQGLVTDGGRDRGKAVARCGRPAVAMTHTGHLGLVALRCRDRACPRCQRLRAIERAAELREAMAGCPVCMSTGKVRTTSSPIDELDELDQGPETNHEPSTEQCRACSGRGSVPWRWQFATLTVPKVHASRRGARETVSYVLDRWRELTTKRYALGREFHERYFGGIRSVEVVYREAGTVIRYPNGREHVVELTGWHVHVHALLDPRPGSVASSDWLVARWCELTGGVSAGQLVKDVERGDTGVAAELAKYVAKPLSMAMDRAVGRELFTAIHGRRLLEGLGRWRSWRKLAERDKPSLLVGPSLHGLRARMAGDIGNPLRNVAPETPAAGRELIADLARKNPRAIFEGHVAGERVVADLGAAEVWRLLRSGNAYAEVPAEVSRRNLEPVPWERNPFVWSRATIDTCPDCSTKSPPSPRTSRAASSPTSPASAASSSTSPPKCSTSSNSQAPPRPMLPSIEP